MADLHALIVQAMQFSNLIPSGSLCTLVMSTIYDCIVEDLGEVAVMDVKDYLLCSLAHVEEHCLAFFPFMRQSALHFTIIYSLCCIEDP